MLRLKTFFIFFTIYLCSFSQDYNKGLKCFLDKDFICSRSYFSNIVNSDQYSDLTVESAYYYLFLSALNSYHSDTEYLFKKFIKKFPLSNRHNDAKFYMSKYLFEKKKFEDVVDMMSQVNLYHYSNSRQKEVFFYLGYSAYKIHDYDLAKNSFYELTSGFMTKYSEDAMFYNSHILFIENKLDLALSGFESVANSKKYSKEVPYFISSILFSTNEYQTLVNYLDPLLISADFSNYQDLVLFQAKSFYHLEEYDQSIAYFEEYKQLNPILTRDQLYQIGFAYYKKGLYGFAINHLNKIAISASDSLAQYAFYYLGDSYLKIENQIEALNAYRSASLIEKDSLIQHDAFYQFVILCYENKNPLYDAEIYLTEFMEKYPNSKNIDEIYSCLANLHLNTHDYDNAIKVLEKSSFINNDVKYQYQKICFHKGVQLFNDELYNDAISYFDKAINVGSQNSLLSKLYYWKGESYYNLNMFDNALSTYSKITNNTPLYPASLYSQAYSSLKKQEFSDAISFFEKLIRVNDDQSVKYDTYVRMGDSYFAINKYQLAVDYYNHAMSLSGFEDDYAAYKKSTSYILLNDYSNAIQSFNYLIDNFAYSNYLDDAIFDLGNVYILSRNFDLAVKTFSKIINGFEKSLFYPEANLKLGLVYYMQNKDSDAILVLKRLISDTPQIHILREALGILKNIYNEMGEADQFLEFIKNIEHDYTKSELDSSTYSSAEFQYLQKNYENSINSFNSYLSYYPSGLFVLEAKYFLYKSYEQINQLENAIEILSEIVDDRENKYTIDGLLNLGRMSFEMEKYISAEKYFSKLLNLASTVEHKKSAILGLLESKFNLYKYNDVINNIASYIEEGFFSGKELIRIRYLNAYSLYKTNQINKSLIEFRWLIDNTEGELRAESLYYTSLMQHNNKNYELCQEIIFQLINEMPSYQSWIEKSLLTLAKNYIIQEDLFQAQHVLIELEKKSQNEDVLNELRIILLNHFPNKLDTLNKN